MAKSDSTLRLKVRSKIGDHQPNNCFQCMRCTSGCPSMKMLELMPHQIVSMVKFGLIDELISSGIIWACATCHKCRERCPQNVAPVDLIVALRNLAVDMEANVPEGYLKVIGMLLEIGLIQKPQEVASRDFEAFTRDSLELPEISYASDKFKLALMTVLQSGLEV